MQSSYGFTVNVGRGRGRRPGPGLVEEWTGDAAAQSGLEPADAVRLLRRARRALVRAARADEAETLSSLLHDHLGPRAPGLTVVEESWPAYEHVNVQTALDVWLEDAALQHRTVGVVGFQHRPFGLADLLSREELDDPFGPRPGTLARVNVAAGPDGQVLACVQCAVYLVTEGERRAAVLVRGPDASSGESEVRVQVAGSDPDLAPQLARRLRALAAQHNVFRGQVLSFGSDVFGEQTVLRFHRRPALAPGGLVLPAETLATVHRQVIDVARHKHRLLAAGQHLKRGVLLYGPPGVGKTHTVRHLVGDLTDTTVIQLTGRALHLVAEACSVARSLQPAMVVIEDVDLIAEDRGMFPGEHPLLFQLLDEMDGLAEDADVVFLLTTNRADLLELALAARPGRVDQAVELTLPDETARRRLFTLYKGRLDVDETRLDDVMARTDGVTASFLKELLRRAAVLSAVESGGDVALRVTADQLDQALAELLDTRNAMTRVLLGAGRGGAPRLDDDDALDPEDED